MDAMASRPTAPADGGAAPAAIPGGPQDIASILDRAVRESPDAEALADPSRRYSYGELDAAVDRAAALLLKLGAARGLRVAGSAPNGCDIVIAFLATQRIGAVWVGLNRVLPAHEKARLAGHAGAAVLLADASTLAEMAALSGEPAPWAVCEMDAAGAWLKTAPEGFTRRAIDPHAVAAINYTSGTTGEPKGILHSQHSLLAPAAAITAFSLAGAPFRRGVILPLTITNVMVVGPLIAFLNGAACICATGAKPAELIDWIERERIEVFSAVPAVVYDLVHAEAPPRGLKALLSGGAPLPLATASLFHERYGFWATNTYGLTEAPTIVTETGARGEAPAGSSGLPLPHIALTIRDESGRPLPAGAVGEICLEAVADGPWARVYSPTLGYWRDEARSHALAATPWLRTGDVGRLDAEGWLFVEDRKSELILRGGSNVYPQEIARVIEADRRVAACAIVGVPDERLGERSFAFVQPASGIADEDRLIDDLREACRLALPSYKRPDFWGLLPVLPRNPAGKVMLPELRRMARTLL